MKINITIEVDDKELKGLIFGEEKKLKKPKNAFRSGITYVKHDAKCILNQLKEVAYEYGIAYVADFKNLTGMYSYPEDAKFGWTAYTLEHDAKVEYYRDGIYRLMLPMPVSIG